ncbi:cytochrome P450 [Aspergillus homomorphus CBS 101889]|uniref:Cytochrome P450 n=1 Tax=Aspergillus homomorphus (strain CBS 101889) TaxID=1450537 RepID=A0A395HY99_ASPHC|nr:cytochrome P450 [Aspergillus homomorphus CBS 101889]RAL12479.1 cytochrome P450 [Aspergillus homomorphus CBS 101889]
MELYYIDLWLQEPGFFVKSCLLVLSIVIGYQLQKAAFYPHVHAPFVGFRFYWEPRWLVGLRFSKEALQHIQQGCRQYKDGMFRIARVDTEILAIPSRFVDELHSKPDDQLSAIKAHMKNLLGRYSTIDILDEGILHTQVLQTDLTPRLGSLTHAVKDELDFALAQELPSNLTADDWTPVCIYNLILRIVARISARIFVGLPTCRNEEWLNLSIDFTGDVFLTMAILRRFPRLLRPLIAPLIPRYWAIRRGLGTANRLIGSLVRERRIQQAKTPDYEKPTDLLQWMMDKANPFDGRPEKLAHRQLILSLAAIHTTTASATQAVYDLCVHQDYVEPLRSEVLQAVAEDGGQYQKTTLTKMWDLDSFIKEVQRLNPPALLSFQRIVMRDLSLSDGTVLPKGTHLAVPAADIAKEAEYDPEFDGFRYSRRRRAHSAAAHRHQFATTDSTSLHFGHGKYACPGRFFAANEIKMILAHLLVGYEFQLPTGTDRPSNLMIDEVFLVDHQAKIWMKRRRM